MEKRAEESFLAPAHRAAVLLDPRLLAAVADQSLPDMGCDVEACFHACKASVQPAIEEFASDPAHRAALKKDFDDYVARRGLWARVELPKFDPEHDAPRKVILDWWRHRAPSKHLRAFALHCHSLRLTAGVSELSWAFMSRQAVPIRNRLGSSTQAKLVNVMWNGQYIQELAPALPTKRARKRKRTEEVSEESSDTESSLEASGAAFDEAGQSSTEEPISEVEDSQFADSEDESGEKSE